MKRQLFLVLILLILTAPAAWSMPATLPISPDPTFHWLGMTQTEKMIYVSSQLNIYREQNIPVFENSRFFVEQINDIKYEPSSFKVSIDQIVAYILIKTFPEQDSQAHGEYIHNVRSVYFDVDKKLYNNSFGKITSKGTFKDFYQDNQLLEEWSYTNGRLNGVHKIYYPNGSLYQTTYYKDGLLEQAGIIYYSDGTIKSIEFFEQGKLNGTGQYFYQDGQLKSKVTFNMGVPIGTMQSYNKDGQLKHELQIENGTVANFYVYDEKGQLSSSVNPTPTFE